MAERYDFYVHDNRKITFDLAEPIMREDSGVTDFVFHIPKVLNELEVSDWAWWLVFVNAKKEKYSIALTLSDDPERPLEYNLATYTVDYAMSIKAGAVQFALEAINAGTGGAIDNEWHTLTYETKVKETLQGNQAEYAETESDIISALLEEVRTKMNQIIGGATPTPVASVSQMTDTSKLYLLTTDGEWYYYNGSAWVSGGVYGARVTDAVPTQGSTNAVSSGGVWDALTEKVDAVQGKGLSTNDYTDADKEKVTNLPSGIEDVLQTIQSVNLYDASTCDPQDGKMYNTIYGNVANSASYAITGKIPVEENTQYIFSTGGIAKVKYVCYYSGENGETYLSDETLDNAPFTTPSSCTFVAFSIFARTHTEEEFNSAIAVAQLEKGDTATAYVPYGSRTVYSPIAADSDVGKALKVKTVKDGRVVEWEYGESGGSGSSDSGLDEIAPVTKSKNLYNPAVCNPQDGKAYSTSGALIDSVKYAVTGKIPVEPETEYIFSTGGYANPRYVVLLGNDDGSRFIREVSINGASFTTTSETTYIDVELFATTHTTTDFENAIANSQLEKGNIATPYVPYFEERKVPTNKLVEGDAFTSIIEKSDNYSESTSLVNQYDKTLAEDGKYFNTAQAKIYAHANFAFSGLIPVKPNTQYNISRNKTTFGTLGSYYQEWDDTKTFVQESQQPHSNSYILQIQTGANTRYISLNYQFGAAHTAEQYAELVDSVMLVEGMMRPLEYSAYNSEPTIKHEKIDIMRQINADRFRGKKWLVTGTSVSYQDSQSYTEGVAEGELVRGYIGNVSRCKPMLIRNEGISGSTLADTTQDTALINRYQNLNMGSYDFITVEYGINDFGRNVPVGTAQDTAGTSTFAACLKTIIEYALAQNPIVGLIICTDPDVRGATTNQNGNTLKDYADVTLEIAKMYRLPVCDWFYHSGINALTRGDGTSRYALTQAGTHPSVYGHMRMGAMLNQVFDSLLC